MCWVITPVMSSGRLKLLMQIGDNCESILNFSGNCSLFSKKMGNKLVFFLSCWINVQATTCTCTGPDFTEGGFEELCSARHPTPGGSLGPPPGGRPPPVLDYLLLGHFLISPSQASHIDPPLQLSPSSSPSLIQPLLLLLVSFFPWKLTQHWQ